MSKKQKRKNISGLKECKYYIDGMHCSSCEILIEKKFLKEKNVQMADASLSKGYVWFQYEGEKPSVDLLTGKFKGQGYIFSERKFEREKNAPIFKVVNKSLIINKKKLGGLINILLATTFIIFAFRFIQNSSIASNIVLNSNSSYFSFFIFGIIAGLSSCAALIGGLLLSLSKQWSEMYIDLDSKAQRLKPFVMFNIGRLVSFILLGGLLGLIGSSLGISLDRAPVPTAIVVILVSLVMFVLGLQMLGVQWAYKVKIALPKFITNKVSSEDKFKGKYMPFLVGALTFFLPCGFTLIAQGLALASGSFLSGSLMMFAFALGTFPILAIISLTSVNVTQKPKLNAFFSNVAGILVLLFAIYNFNSQLNVLGLKSFNDIKLPSITKETKTETNQTNAEIDEEGNQLIKIKAVGFQYIPLSGTIIKSNTPTKLIVDNQGIEGCGVYMAARGLMSNYIYLKAGENVVDIPNPVKGTYKITCSMGMVPPVTIRVI